MIRFMGFVLCLVFPVTLTVASEYAGQESRAISSLSAEDVAALEAGAGWGLAKPAELNGWPGPRHVLDEAEALKLSEEQRAAIEVIFEDMRRAAVAAGLAYIDAEAALDAAFRDAGADADRIAALSERAGVAHAALRAVHLKAHLRTKPILTAHQAQKYQILRGYAGAGAHHGRGHGHRHDD